MAKVSSAATPKTALDEMEQLKKRYEELSRKKTVCETNLENARKNLEALQAEARERYGTDDLEALRKQLEEMKAENQRKQEDYKASLDAIEANLKDVDRNYQAQTET